MSLASIFQQHPYIATVIATWIFNNVITALITALPAPTKDSKPGYVYAFKVLNSVMGNVQRALRSNIEKSPNWQDALAKQASSGQQSVQ